MGTHWRETQTGRGILKIPEKHMSRGADSDTTPVLSIEWMPVRYPRFSITRLLRPLCLPLRRGSFSCAEFPQLFQLFHHHLWIGTRWKQGIFLFWWPSFMCEKDQWYEFKEHQSICKFAIIILLNPVTNKKDPYVVSSTRWLNQCLLYWMRF